MKILDWIKGIFNRKDKIEAIEAPKGDILSPAEQFRRECVESAQIPDEERLAVAREQERQRQIRVAGYNVLGMNCNLDSEDIKRALMAALNNVRTTDQSLELAVTDLDIEALKDLHIAVQNNPQQISYLNRIDPQTRDNNIIEVVERMEKQAKQEALNWGWLESKAGQYIPSTSNKIIAQLQEEQRQMVANKEMQQG